ncbi:MAG: hypothetical protein JSS82_10665 [Bacteroidetes bacterium]|nr:hypothetical protein [Bacteroidota bacterium]
MRITYQAKQNNTATYSWAARGVSICFPLFVHNLSLTRSSGCSDRASGGADRKPICNGYSTCNADEITKSAEQFPLLCTNKKRKRSCLRFSDPDWIRTFGSNPLQERLLVYFADAGDTIEKQFRRRFSSDPKDTLFEHFILKNKNPNCKISCFKKQFCFSPRQVSIF